LSLLVLTLSLLDLSAQFAHVIQRPPGLLPMITPIIRGAIGIIPGCSGLQVCRLRPRSAQGRHTELNRQFIVAGSLCHQAPSRTLLNRTGASSLVSRSEWAMRSSAALIAITF
jgi:hypothetical protein